ncbi:MAG: pilus assembly PilX N-terminal domain-containing protein [Proteobacteria bacterium]|nr:pilus assembly PilX N-terminal domain-containing protein [Pseudomonadota bacterium]MBU1058349.1 pilus assembly PilX N-terminal domain-containing protein [Pseudomonadota bacterium]
MRKQLVKAGNEEGFVLITALMIMVVMTIIGIAATFNTTTEVQIAGNDRIHKETFYSADGGTEFAAEVLEQNIACLDFAPNGEGSKLFDGINTTLDGHIAVSGTSLELWQNVIGTWSAAGTPYPSDTARDLWYPPVYAAGAAHTNITVEGIADITAGSSILQNAGYLGLGRSFASGGVTLDYEIYAQRLGERNSESRIRVEWKHVVGREDPHCRYN